jgi:epoxyqueuosine reductase
MPASAPSETLTDELKREASRLGFALAGTCPAIEPTGIGGLADWLAAGCAGEMHYLPNRAEAYSHPRSVLEGTRSLLMLAMV